jgi:hypothetical protein
LIRIRIKDLSDSGSGIKNSVPGSVQNIRIRNTAKIEMRYESADLEPQLWLLAARPSSPSPRLGGRSTWLLQQELLLVLVRRRGSGSLSSEARHGEQLGEGMGCSAAPSRRLLEQTARSRLIRGRPIKK